MLAAERSKTTGSRPRVVHDPAELRETIRQWRQAGKSLGVVPTMGALHEGHLSLARASCAACDATITTIFVNPTQFAPGEDFKKYPRTLSGDLDRLAPLGVDVVFAPEVDAVYAPGHDTYVEMGAVARPLEGACRPDHFRGVATIVLKLFHYIPADVAFFGRKDYQQCLVVKKMVADLNLPISIEVLPIVREVDGLALSSRNAYLSADERRRALSLSQALKIAGSLYDGGQRDAQPIKAAMREHLQSAGQAEIDYVQLVREGTVEPVHSLDGPTTALVAARIGATRLIDNWLLGETFPS